MKIQGRKQKDLDAAVLRKSIEENQRYLDDTDFLVIRAIDTGDEMFPDVKTKRAAARDTISSARAALKDLEG